MPTATASRSGTGKARTSSPGQAKSGPKRTQTSKTNAPASRARTRAGSGSTAKSKTGAAKEQAKRTTTRAGKAGAQVATVAAGQSRKVAGQAKEQGREVASTAAERGGALVQAAKQDAGALVGTVRSRAGEVTGELQAHTRSLAAEARSQIEGQAETGALRLAVAFQEMGEEAQALAEGRPEDAPRLCGYVFGAADRAYVVADRLHALADDIQDRGLPGVLDDVQDFARRRPGAFLVGATVVGFGLGRLVKAAKADQDGDGAYEAAGRGAGPNGRVAASSRALPARAAR